MDRATPRLLQIFREPLKPGVEDAYDAIEREIARTAAALGCPHPYLAAESVTGPHEVWWFNGYESEEERQKVYAAYAANTPLLEALRASSEQKASMTLAPIDVVAAYREDLSTGPAWAPGQGRWLVIISRLVLGPGTVFEAPDGTLYGFSALQTRDEAQAVSERAGAEANVYAVRPAWSFPDEAWVAADPGFWQGAAS